MGSRIRPRSPINSRVNVRKYGSSVLSDPCCVICLSHNSPPAGIFASSALAGRRIASRPAADGSRSTYSWKRFCPPLSNLHLSVPSRTKFPSFRGRPRSVPDKQTSQSPLYPPSPEVFAVPRRTVPVPEVVHFAQLVTGLVVEDGTRGSEPGLSPSVSVLLLPPAVAAVPEKSQLTLRCFERL